MTPAHEFAVGPSDLAHPVPRLTDGHQRDQKDPANARVFTGNHCEGRIHVEAPDEFSMNAIRSAPRQAVTPGPSFTGFGNLPARTQRQMVAPS